MNMPLQKMFQEEVTDHLLGYDDRSVYWQVLNLTYFFHQRWGVSVSYQPMTSGRISKRDERFRQQLEQMHGDHYFVEASTGAAFEEFSLFSGHFERGFIGIVYRTETDRFYIYPQLSVGVTSWSTDWGSAFLKKKNSNEVYRLLYETEDERRVKDRIMLASSVSAGYKLLKDVYLNFDLMLNYAPNKFTYISTLTDLNTHTVATGSMPYRRDIFNFSAGAGIIVVLTRR